MDYYESTVLPEGFAEGSGAVLAGLGIFLAIIGVIVVAWAIFYLIGMVKLYKKCGKGGWEAIVPIYNNYVLVDIAGLNWWWFLLMIASSLFVSTNGDSVSTLAYVGGIASLFANINVAYNMSKKFHKETVWIVLAVLFGGIVYPILGYSKKEEYDASVPVSKNGLIDKDKAEAPAAAASNQTPAPDTTQTPSAATPVAPVVAPVAPEASTPEAPATPELNVPETPSAPEAPVMPEAPEVTPGPAASDLAPVTQEAPEPEAPVEDVQSAPTATTSPIGISEVNSDVVNVPNEENKQ